MQELRLIRTKEGGGLRPGCKGGIGFIHNIGTKSQGKMLDVEENVDQLGGTQKTANRRAASMNRECRSPTDMALI